MKLNQTFDLVSIGDETMAVPVGDESQKFVVRLNESAAEIFEMLKDEISEEEIVSRLCEKYENGKEEIAAFVAELLKEFSDKGILSGND